jgi:hypothetical protein
MQAMTPIFPLHFVLLNIRYFLQIYCIFALLPYTFCMRKFVMVFLIFVALYHCLVTFFSFGQWRVSPYVILLIRDIGWAIAIACVALSHKKKIRKHFKQRWLLWLIALVLCIVSIATSIALGVDVKHIAVWIKYTLYYIVPFLTAIYLGTVWHAEYDKKTFGKWIFWAWKFLIFIIIFGWIWQIAKNILPDFFSLFGYWPLGDYVFAAKPPLYYLTGPRGIQRLSGIFSWPNNYWYFLVVFFWLFRYGIRAHIKSRSWKTILRGLYCATILATLSRWAILWVLIQALLISYVIYNTKRRIILVASIAGLLAVGWLSALKWQSTVAHINAKMASLQYVQAAPLWYGLGSSGPSVHSQWWYLPENFFIQVMMDLWAHGFIIRALFRLATFVIIARMYKKTNLSRNLIFFISVWFVGIMLEWLFLHVLEDSMVNYLYFVVWGIVLGYASAE